MSSSCIINIPDPVNGPGTTSPSSCTSNTASFETGRRRLPELVFTSADLATPSLPTNNLRTRPLFHLDLVCSFSQIRTKAPVDNGLAGRHHLVLRVSSGKYSNIHLFYKQFFRFCRILHCFLRAQNRGLNGAGVCVELGHPNKK